MPKVAILGANGQVGAELCLLLSQDPSIDLVPICRNRTGSAFLRWMGVRCRHGRPAISEEAPFLFGDCDFIVNSALASGSPGAVRRAEDAIVRNAFRHSPPHAKVIHFSTQSVYGDARPGRLIRWRSLYGRAKIGTERSVRNEAARSGKGAYILRLGHVGGTLQDISNNIRHEISEGRVVLPAADVPSNIVYTATIVDAVMTVIRGGVTSGCYDLMNMPQWTWRQVYEFEAASLGTELCAAVVSNARRKSSAQLVKTVIRAASDLAAGPMARQLIAAGLAHLPAELNARAHAWWHCKRARAELATLQQSPVPAEHLTWVANGTRFLPGLRNTQDAFKAGGSNTAPFGRAAGVPWADDLAPAAVDAPALTAIRARTS